ncbi:MAG: glycosyltransferase family 2 protein [Candidatus Hydrothermales bacterium]
MKDLSLIIVNYYSKDLIKELLDSLPYSVKREAEIIIVNNSPSENLDFEGYPFLKVINNEANLGFAKAVNIGIKVSRGEYILLVNPDVKFISGFESALELIKKRKEIGMLVPLMINKNGEKIPPWRDTESHFRTLLFLLGYADFIKKKEKRRIKEKFVPLAPCACALFPSKVFKRVGYFDENFFLFKEDGDLVRRLRKEKFYIYFYPKWIVYHEFGGTHKESLFAFYHRIRSLYYFYKKNQKIMYPFIRILLPLFFLIKSILSKNFKYFLISLNFKIFLKNIDL